jgi:ferritin-like metal-binding protein YciE
LKNSWRSYKTQLNKIYKMNSRNNKTPQIKNLRKQLNELREDFNKHQSETKEAIKRYMK